MPKMLKVLSWEVRWSVKQEHGIEENNRQIKITQVHITEIENIVIEIKILIDKLTIY